MNRGQIRQKARRKLDELTASFWSDDELNDYILQSYHRHWQIMVDLQYRKALDSTLLSITANTREVALPSDFLRARLLEHKVGNVWYPCRYYERFDTSVGDSVGSGATFGDYYSFAYSFIGDDLILEPTPITAETSTLRLTYFYQPEDFDDDSDTPDFPSIYHDLLVLDCVIQAKEKEEMIVGSGADIAPFRSDYADLYKKFIDNINNMTNQRLFVEPFGI